jgi:hypothetical protein
MKLPLHSLTIKLLSTLLYSTTLIACGGGNSSTGNAGASLTAGDVPTALAAAPAAAAPAALVAGADAALPVAVGTSTASGEAAAVSSLPVGETVTDVRVENTSLQEAQTNVPVTFGQVFAVGHVLRTNTLSARLDDGTTIPLQMDVKATHPDGSVRHAVISGIVPTLGAGATRTLSLTKDAIARVSTAATIGSLMGAGLNASVHLMIGGVDYWVAADDLMKLTKPTVWLAGPVATEWQVSAPLKTSAGVQHPHLAARYAVRWYPTLKKARIDVTVENNWAYEPSPQNFTYDAQVIIGAKPAYVKTGLTHRHHARWRKVLWWNGAEPQVNIKHNTAYLIASRALPNYDQSLTVPEAALAALKARWTGAITEPMAVGLATPYMPSTGGRDDIGLLPGWAAEYLLSMDKRAKEVTLGTADLAGSWSSHYRDRNTGRPVSLMTYPYMTILGRQGDTYNPVTKKSEAFPACATGADCTTPNTHDVPHQPNFAYLPYLVTGDYYYLEELQFWAMFDAFSSNPGYRQYVKGLLSPEQVRGQAWGLRTLSEAAYITPDTDPLKADFIAVVNSNLDWYNATYTDNPAANKLGVVINGFAIGYNNGTGLAPWQDDFFTAAVGHTAELGFEKAKSLLLWKIKFPVDRMTAPGTCWIDGAIYAMTVRDSETSPLYATMAEAYKASHTAEFNALGCNSPQMASSLGLKLGQMTGYSEASVGYPSNMQPALAYAADVGGMAGTSAWAIFMARSVKPDYSSAPAFAIVPR